MTCKVVTGMQISTVNVEMRRRVDVNGRKYIREKKLPFIF